MALEIADLLQRLGAAWEPNPPPPDGALDRVARAVKRPMPDELRALYERANGGSVGPVDLFTLAEYEDVNRTLAKKMPFAAFFASDGSDGFFFVDDEDKLKHGRGAVFWVDRGRVAVKECVPCGVGLYPFLLSVAAGLIPWDAPRLKEGAVARLEAALAKHAAVVRRRPPADAADILVASQRVGVFLPESLRTLYKQTNGLEVDDVRVFDLDALAPADAKLPDGSPVAVWFGERAGGVRFAASVVGWRENEGGRALVVAPGQSLDEAPLRAPVTEFVAELVDAAASGRKEPA